MKKILNNIFKYSMGKLIFLLLLSFLLFLIWGFFNISFDFIKSDILNPFTKWTIIILCSISLIYLFVMSKFENWISFNEHEKNISREKKVFNTINKCFVSIICVCLIILLSKLVYSLLTPIIIDTYNKQIEINPVNVSNDNIDFNYVIGSLLNFFKAFFEYFKKYLFLIFLVGLSYIYIPSAILKLLRKIFSFNNKYLSKVDVFLKQIF